MRNPRHGLTNQISRLAGASGLRRRRRLPRRWCRNGFRRRHLGFANERGPLFDDDPHRLEVAVELAAGFELAALGHRDVSIDRPMDRDRLRLDLALDVGIFSKRQNAFGDDFPVKLSIKNQLVLELQGPVDFNVSGKDVLCGGGFGGEGGQIVQVHACRFVNLLRGSQRSILEASDLRGA